MRRKTLIEAGINAANLPSANYLAKLHRTTSLFFPATGICENAVEERRLLDGVLIESTPGWYAAPTLIDLI